MNVTHKKVYTIYKVLYKIKQLENNFKTLTLELLTKATDLSQLRSGSRQHVWETVTGEMESLYCVLSDVSDKLYCIHCIGYFTVLVYAISVIMMVYTISYREISYQVNRIQNTVCSAVYTQTADSCQI